MSPLNAMASTGRYWIKRFCADESGTTAIEYAIIASGISVFIVAAVMSLGSQLKTTFYDKLTNVIP